MPSLPLAVRAAFGARSFFMADIACCRLAILEITSCIGMANCLSLKVSASTRKCVGSTMCSVKGAGGESCSGGKMCDVVVESFSAVIVLVRVFN